MSLSNNQNQDEIVQDRGLALGIDFGNSQISAAVWRPEKRQQIWSNSGINQVSQRRYISQN